MKNLFKTGLIWRMRMFIYQTRENWREKNLIKKILRFSSTVEGNTFAPEATHIEKNGLSIFPYDFSKAYPADQIKVSFENGFPFVTYLGKSLFFPKNYSEKKIKRYTSSLLIEQHPDSPHAYFTDLENTDVLFDIGCGEGNFTLEHIEEVKRAFLFELDSNWFEPLAMTFSNWKNKVTVIGEAIGRSEKFSALDLVAAEDQNVVLKIDVDGAERMVLSGLESLFDLNLNFKIAICTYHQQDDARDFEQYFKSKGFSTSFSENYMLFYCDREIRKPFFRKGLLFATRSKL